MITFLRHRLLWVAAGFVLVVAACSSPSTTATTASAESRPAADAPAATTEATAAAGDPPAQESNEPDAGPRRAIPKIQATPKNPPSLRERTSCPSLHSSIWPRAMRLRWPALPPRKHPSSYGSGPRLDRPAGLKPRPSSSLLETTQTKSSLSVLVPKTASVRRRILCRPTEPCRSPCCGIRRSRAGSNSASMGNHRAS